MSNIGNYAKHAFMWDLYGPDVTEEREYWFKYAGKYGKNVLIPMCAVGKDGVYMAERGYNITAFDITPEMIEEGIKRFGTVKNLKLLQGDVRDFNFDIEPADFCYCTDFGHIQTIEDIKKAFRCINRHLRKGGGFVILTGLREPDEKTEYFPTKNFDFGEVAPGIKMRKINTSECRSEGDTGRFYIIQEVYIEDMKSGNVEMFEHAFYLQSYYREEWINALNDCGFDIMHEYGSWDKKIWAENDDLWIAEAVKR